MAVTVIVDAVLPPALHPDEHAVIVVGAALNVDWLAAGLAALTLIVAVCVIAIPLMVADAVLVSALVVFSVHIACPLTSVVAVKVDGFRVFPVVGETDNVTLAPGTTVPN